MKKLKPQKKKNKNPSFIDGILQTAALSRQALGLDARDKIDAFIITRQNSDGGFGENRQQSDLPATFFSVAVLRSLTHAIPLRKVWKYIRKQKIDSNLSLTDFTYLIRLRLAFPHLKRTEKIMFGHLKQYPDTGIKEQFLLALAKDDFSSKRPLPDISLESATPTLAAGILLSAQNTDALKDELLARAIKSGGFKMHSKGKNADLISTASALFALNKLHAPLHQIYKPSLKYVEALWGKNGGFVSSKKDSSENAENTFYALLALGCLIKFMVRESKKIADTKST